jgi:hypothetical protein
MTCVIAEGAFSVMWVVKRSEDWIARRVAGGGSTRGRFEQVVVWRGGSLRRRPALDPSQDGMSPLGDAGFDLPVLCKAKRRVSP